MKIVSLAPEVLRASQSEVEASLRTCSKIKKGDNVVVLAGRDKGKRGDVTHVVRDHVIVNGVNPVKKHAKPNPMKNPAGRHRRQGNADRHSNVAIWNPVTKKADRIGFAARGRPQGSLLQIQRRADRAWQGEEDDGPPEGNIQEEIAPALTQQFGYKSPMEVPRITEDHAQHGRGRGDRRQEDPRERGRRHEKIAGQKPVITKARKAIAGFKIREGYPSAAWSRCARRMYEFLDRLVTSRCRACATSAACRPARSTAAATTTWA